MTHNNHNIRCFDMKNYKKRLSLMLMAGLAMTKKDNKLFIN